MTDPPPSLAEIGNRVAARIDALLAGERDRWCAVDADLGPPYDALRAVIAGGKRLRPAFCHWGFVGAGGDPGDPRVVDAGAALELLHTFALVHDDIMDDSSRRHGIACMHVDFAARHASSGGRGESRRFGDGAAILIGDLAFVYADHLMRDAPRAALDVFTELRLEVNVGQYLDLVGTASRAITVEQARTIAVYKSGKYTIERPLHVGAALAGRLDELAEAYTAFGVPLGEAFQLRDDLLDAFGDSAVLGKEAGEDLRSGKPTRLFALARERADTASIAALDGPDLAAIRRVLVDTGARAEVEARVTSLGSSAMAALRDAPVTAEARRELTALADFVTRRDH
ncbi:MAG: polyprenyl synthetase family protein [Acidimicrobiales bacterium]